MGWLSSDYILAPDERKQLRDARINAIKSLFAIRKRKAVKAGKVDSHVRHKKGRLIRNLKMIARDNDSIQRRYLHSAPESPIKKAYRGMK